MVGTQRSSDILLPPTSLQVDVLVAGSVSVGSWPLVERGRLQSIAIVTKMRQATVARTTTGVDPCADAADAASCNRHHAGGGGGGGLGDQKSIISRTVGWLRSARERARAIQITRGAWHCRAFQAVVRRLLMAAAKSAAVVPLADTSSLARCTSPAPHMHQQL